MLVTWSSYGGCSALTIIISKECVQNNVEEYWRKDELSSQDYLFQSGIEITTTDFILYSMWPALDNMPIGTLTPGTRDKITMIS